MGQTVWRRLIRHLERGAVLRPCPPVIVDSHGADVRMPKPFLHLGDVGLMIERVGGGRRAKRVCADLEPERRRISERGREIRGP